MFSFIRRLLLGKKHSWQYFMINDHGEWVQARYCRECKQWQEHIGQGRYRNSNMKPHYAKGVYYVN